MFSMRRPTASRPLGGWTGLLHAAVPAAASAVAVPVLCREPQARREAAGDDQVNLPAAPALGLETPDPTAWLGLALLVAVEVRGARALRRRRPDLFPRWRGGCFVAALAALGLALYSPLDGLGAFLLVAHMAQHLLLAMVVPPLLLLGAPPAVILRGLPRPVLRQVVAPLFADPRLRVLGSVLVHPVTAAVALIASSWLWHFPALYQRALADPQWHAAEHASFLAAGLLFWWPLVEPPPFHPRWSRWAMIPYLLIADLQNTALAALFVFGERVLYPHYAGVPRPWGIDALADQARAGALMWVVGSVAFLVPVALIVGRLLAPVAAVGGGTGAPPRRLGLDGVGGRALVPGGVAGASGRLAVVPGGAAIGALAKPAPGTAGWWRAWAPGAVRIGAAAGLDVRVWHRLGRFVGALGTRRAVQLLLCGLAAIVVMDGLNGPVRSSENLAGILPWTWWRTLLFAGLLAAGNLFCGVCPFMLPRDLARRWVRPDRRWPRVLRRKWIAVALLLCGFVAYEVFDLWDDPGATAWVVLAYFAAALVVDVLFAGASFCKWLCPIGQMNFVASTLSPLEVAVREPAICASCTSRECLRGGAGGRGCELGLYLPTKRGNLDCTFCLDCVRACPVGNVGLQVRTPTRELAFAGARASIGRLRHRRDFAALMGLFVFGALVNAAGMSAPVVRGEAWLGARAGLAVVSGGVVTAAWMLLALGALAPALVLAAAALGRRLAHLRLGVGVLAAALVPALVPLGCAIWLIHFCAHFASGWAALVPAAARVSGAALPAGLVAIAAAPSAHATSAGSGTLVALAVGLVMSCAVLGRIARDLTETAATAGQVASANSVRTGTSSAIALAPAARLALPWFGLAVLIFAAAAGVLLAPMEMRGTAAGWRP